MNNIISKDWCLTIHDTSAVPTFYEDKLSYMVYQLEIAPTTNKEHYQAFIQMHKKCRMSGIKKLYPSAHIESRKGTALQASDYCKKEESRKPETTFTEFGELLSQGQRTDLQSIMNNIRNKDKDEEYKHTDTFLRNKRNLESYIQDNQPDRKFKPLTYWIYGKSGTGKSRYIYEYAEKNNLTIWPGNKDYDNFWNGYENQDIVLMDDFRYKHCRFDRLLEVLDRYPCNVNVKGGYRKLNSKIMCIISNNTPQEVYCYDQETEQMRQLIRRLDYIIEKKKGQDLVIPSYQSEEEKASIPVTKRKLAITVCYAIISFLYTKLININRMQSR